MAPFVDSLLARAIRDVDAPEPSYERQSLKPRFMMECVGTPRRELQENIVNGLRVKPTFNPYAKLSKTTLYQADRWPSRDWGSFKEGACYVQGRFARSPLRFEPRYDELGRLQKQRLPQKAKEDISWQQTVHGVPASRNVLSFARNGVDPADKLDVPQRWLNRLNREKQIASTQDTRQELIDQYRRECYLKRPHKWWERIVRETAGSTLSAPYIRKVLPPVTKALFKSN